MNIKQHAVVGILGCGEIGSAIKKVCHLAGFTTLVRELTYDEINGHHIDFLHVNIPEKSNIQFVKFVSNQIKTIKPKLTIVNSSVTPGTTRKIYTLTNRPIVHSPVIGVHPHLYKSIKSYFSKVIGPVNPQSLSLAKKHLSSLGLKLMIYRDAEESEAAKLLDLVYYAWNIIFCKWVNEVCIHEGWDFNNVYTRQNEIYNFGYKKLRPNVIRPILLPIKGPIGGHCTIQDTMLFHHFHKNLFTEFILDQNAKYEKTA